MGYSDDSVVQKRARVSGILCDKSIDNRIRFIQTNVSSLYRAVSYDILGTATAPVSVPTANALPGRTRWQGGDQPGRQAHKLEETSLSYEHNTKQDDNNAVFRRNDT